jgi:class 3 adenylate cyclase
MSKQDQPKKPQATSAPSAPEAAPPSTAAPITGAVPPMPAPPMSTGVLRDPVFVPLHIGALEEHLRADLSASWSSSPSYNRFGRTRSGFILDDDTPLDLLSQFKINYLADSPASELQAQISTLRAEIEKKTRELNTERTERGAATKEKEELAAQLQSFSQAQTLNFVLHRIHPDAHATLLKSDEMQQTFLRQAPCTAYVMSVDIRRSTDLMLKAKTAQDFAVFISELCRRLAAVVLEWGGVFDKFTGDGILAFFPEFYSGVDAGYRAVQAADQCHKIFDEHFSASKSRFIAVLKDTGLGVGIDYGSVHLVRINDGLTVVGTPVVYACRLGGAPRGSTLLNQPAYDEIFSKYSAYCTTEATEIEIKHEGRLEAHSVFCNAKDLKLEPPAWHRFRDSAKA